MAEHGERGAGTDSMTEEPESTDKPEADAEATTHIRRAKRQPPNWTQLRERGAGILAAVLRWVGLVFAVILVAHIILVIGEANPDNWITMTVADLAGPLSIGFQDLFIIADQKLELLVNYGLAAIFWLVVSAIAARIVRRLGGSSL